MGGDSVTAMRIVLVARRNKVRVTVAAILENPQLSKLAAVLDEELQGEDADAIDAEDVDVALLELLDEALGLQSEDM